MIDYMTYSNLYRVCVRKLAAYLEMDWLSLDTMVMVCQRRHQVPRHTALRMVRDRVLRQLRHG